MANDIVRRSEAPEISGKTIQEAEDKVSFLQQEAIYNEQVYSALASVRNVNQILDKVETARAERRILDSLHLLESKHVPRLGDLTCMLTLRIRRVDSSGCDSGLKIMSCHEAAELASFRAQVFRP